jgi:hypothetical protein
MLAIVTASTLNLRPDPSTALPPLAKLPRGSAVEILETLGGWYRVRTDHGDGFVRGDYVMLADPAPTPAFLGQRADLLAIPLAATPPLATAGLAGPALGAARAWNRHGGLLRPVAAELAMRPSAAVAVLVVESGGNGFGADGRLLIRFENHVFFDQWGAANPKTFARYFQFDATRRWTGHTFRAAANRPFARFHGTQAGEWNAFEVARGQNAPAALRAISMGAPQIMGFNHGRVGYDSAADMFDAFAASAAAQILAMFDFIKGPGATSPQLQALQRDQWEQFASLYNGPGNATAYGDRIRSTEAAARNLFS